MKNILSGGNSLKNRGGFIMNKIGLRTLSGVIAALSAGMLTADSLAEEELISTVPTFHSCGVYFRGTTDVSWDLEYTEADKNEWNRAYPMVKGWDKDEWRGSIVGLKSDQEYRIRIVETSGGEERRFTAEFETWNPDPPVAKTVVLDEENYKGGFLITEQGQPDGWIRYVARSGFTLRQDQASQGETADVAVTVRGASYIILEGLTIKGGKKHGITVYDSKHIRIINCDVSEFGQKGEQDLYGEGHYYLSGGEKVIRQSGMDLRNSSAVVVERCYIHDPRSHSNSWRYSHPQGVSGIVLYANQGGNYVLRYNDIIGSQNHRFNDVILGGANASPVGGFGRDSDLYGNMLAFANDDGVELDGGQKNVRVWGNKIQMSMCGISTGPSVLGPSYIWRNLIVNLGDEHGLSSVAFKNSHSMYHRGRVHFFNNTLVVPAGNGYTGYNRGEDTWDSELKGVMRNNLFVCGPPVIKTGALQRHNDFDYDLLWTPVDKFLQEEKERLHAHDLEEHGVFAQPDFVDAAGGDFSLTATSPGRDDGVRVQSFTEDFRGKAPDIGAFEAGMEVELPYRPIPVSLNKAQVKFVVRKDRTEEAPRIVTASVKAGKTYNREFRIRKSDAFDWFTVTPQRGVFKDGEDVEFEVSLHTGMLSPGLHEGIFLIRQDDGYSKPVTVIVDVEGKPEIDLKEGEIFMEAEEAVTETAEIREDPRAFGGKYVVMDRSSDKTLVFQFDVPETNDYLIDVRVKSQLPIGIHDSMFMSIDGDEFTRLDLRSNTRWIWTLAMRERRRYYELFELSKGSHTIRFRTRETVFFDAVKVTPVQSDSPDGGGDIETGRNLLNNGSMIIKEGQKSPSKWRARDEKQPIVPSEGSAQSMKSVEIRIESLAECHGFLIQSVGNLEENRKYRLSGWIRSSVPELGYLQVKQYKDGNELRRLNSAKSQKEWKKVKVDFSTDHTRNIRILCRWMQDVKYEGESVWFSGLTLHQLVPKK